MKKIDEILESARSKYKKINDDIPKLSAYLVFSSRFGQCEISNDLVKVFDEFPRFFKKGDLLEKVISISNKLKKSAAKEVKQKDKLTPLQYSELYQQKKSIIHQLEFSDDIYIEFRFHVLSYELIRKLKSHPLVKQPTHMMRDAYISVVLMKFEVSYD